MFDSHYISGEIFQTHWQPSLLSSNELSWEGISYNQLEVIDFWACSLPWDIPNDAFFTQGDENDPVCVLLMENFTVNPDPMQVSF